MLEVKNWICFNKYVHSAGCPVEFCMGKYILERNEKKSNTKKKHSDGRFYSSLLSLPYRYHNVMIAVTIVHFPREEKFTDLVEMQVMYSHRDIVMEDLEPVDKIRT